MFKSYKANLKLNTIGDSLMNVKVSFGLTVAILQLNKSILKIN